ncbi:MAG: hypothetical protein ACI8Y7_000939 [Candidatus Woesearchaeota archaeon]|jgi:hypothetical protein
MVISQTRIKFLWRTKYPWVIVFYIFAVGLITLQLKLSDNRWFSDLDLMMMAVFTSYVFLYVFYIYGVRPSELEYHFKK